MTTRSTKAEVLRELGGNLKKIDQELKIVRRGAQVLSSNHPRLIDQFPRQWVAVYKGQVRANARTFDRLMDRVDKDNLSRPDLIIRYITGDDLTMLL